MELHALDLEAHVANSHDLAVLGPRGHLELRRAARALDRERMVARRIIGRGQPREDTLARVVDARDLAVHQGLRVHDLAAVGLADRLVAEADAEERQASREAPDHVERYARLVRRAWSRREHDTRWCKRL